MSAAEEAATPTIHTSSRAGLQGSVLHTRTLMTVAACAVVGALLIVPLNFVSIAVAISPGGILIMCALMGLWLIPYLLPGALTKKPGAIIIAALILGIISTFTTPAGIGAIVGNLIGGALLEIPLALTLYRQWNWIGYGLGAIVFGLFNSLLYGTMMQIELSFGQVLLGAALSLISCFAAVAVTLMVVRALRRAGVGVTTR